MAEYKGRTGTKSLIPKGWPVLEIKVSGTSALLVTLWLVQLLIGQGAARADLGLALWTSAIQTRDVEALAQLLDSGFSQVNAASAKGKTALIMTQAFKSV